MLGFGCDDEQRPYPLGPPTTKNEQIAEHLWQERCTTCHGKSGRGDGPGARLLDVKPRDLRSRTWQKSRTDAELESVILRGGAALGVSAGMPPNADLAKNPEVLKLLVRRVRALPEKAE